VSTTLTAEARAALLDWPDRRNCDWDCPWPSYCVDCHSLAWDAMWDGRLRLLSVMTGRSIDEVRVAAVGTVR
jgi:hypothetical protein